MTDAHEEGTKLTLDEVKEKLTALEGDIQVYLDAFSDLRDKQTHFRKNILDLRTQIRLKDQAEDAFETTFTALRKKESSHKDVTDVKLKREELALELEPFFEQYTANLAALRICCDEVIAMLSDEQSKDDVLKYGIEAFKATLDELQQAVKNPSTNYVEIVTEHLQVLVNAARDLFNSVSWSDCSEGMNAIWQSLKTTFDGLLNMAKSMMPSEDLDANESISDTASEASDDSFEDELADFALDEHDADEKEVVPLTPDGVDKEIIALFDDLLDIRDPDNTEKMKSNAETMQRAIKSLFIQAKKQPEFKLTSVQHAALHELRAEAGRNLFEKGLEGVKNQVGTTFSSAKEAFKKWLGGDSDADKPDDPAPKQ